MEEDRVQNATRHVLTHSPLFPGAGARWVLASPRPSPSSRRWLQLRRQGLRHSPRGAAVRRASDPVLVRKNGGYRGLVQAISEKDGVCFFEVQRGNLFN